MMMTPTFASPQAEHPWPPDGLEPKPNCPVCGSSQRTVLHEGLEDRLFRVAPGKWSFHLCSSCHSAWLDPRPTQETIGLAYRRYYTHDVTDHPIVRRKKGLRAFLHDTMNGYRNARYGLRREPSNSIGRWLIPLLPSIRAAVDAECRHLPPPPPDGGRLLDIGIGNGGFLQIASEMGWNAEGIDIDPEAVAAARSRGLNVRCEPLKEGITSEEIYDVITICHVIEHLHDPVGALHSLFSLLKPGGILWLDTPNLASMGYRRFGANWLGLDPPRHLMVFCPDSLLRVLRSCGFVQIRRRWRGLTVFNVYPPSEALAKGSNPLTASRDGKPPLRELLAEFREMAIPNSREFITLTARKPRVP